MGGVADVLGHAAMPPRWVLGYMPITSLTEMRTMDGSPLTGMASAHRLTEPMVRPRTR